MRRALQLAFVLCCFSVSLLAQTLGGLGPNVRYQGSGEFTLRVYGTGFERFNIGQYTFTSLVLWNGTTLPTTYVSDTELTATVSADKVANAGSYEVKVCNWATQPLVCAQYSNSRYLPVQPPEIQTFDMGTWPYGSPVPSQPAGSFLDLRLWSTKFLETDLYQIYFAGFNVYQSSNLGMSVVWDSLFQGYYPSFRLRVDTKRAGLPPGTYPITVQRCRTDAWGQKDCGAAAPQYVTLTEPPFSVTGTVPSSILRSSLDFTLTVAGYKFAPGAVVRWYYGAYPTEFYVLPTTFVDSNTVTATVRTSQMLDPLVANISVVNPDQSETNKVPFTVLPRQATLSTLSPSSASKDSPQLQLAVTGNWFDSSSVAFWGNTQLPTTPLSTTQLRATVPASLLASTGSFPITVKNNGTPVSNALTFTVTPAVTPVLTSISPTSNRAGCSSFTLTAQGSNFDPYATVQWGGVIWNSLQTTFVDSTRLTATVPANYIVSQGASGVRVLNPGGGTSQGLTFTTNPAPGLSGFSPTSANAGGPGFTLAVNGSAFVSGDKILWNGTALQTAFVSASQLTASIPASSIATAGSASISVLPSGCSAIGPLTFTISPAPPPSISSLEPSSVREGSPGMSMTVRGANFASGASVLWNGSQIGTTFVNSTQLSAMVSGTLLSTAGTVQVTVANPGGNPSSPAQFTITRGPAIIGLSPSAVTAGAAGFTLTVSGSGFVAGDTIRWNGSGLTTAFVSSSQLSAPVPPALVSTAGSANIEVATALGTTSNVATFTINPPGNPVISGLSRYSATAGEQSFPLTISGSGFLSGASVTWHQTSLQPSAFSATQITVQVPAELLVLPGDLPITVVNPGGAASNALSFTVKAAPAVTSLSPAAIKAGSSTFTLTVNGNGFSAGDTVLWNGAAIPTSFLSSNQATAQIVASLVANAGSVTVSVRTASGISSNSATFTITPQGAPTLQSLSRTSAVAGEAGFVLTVNGAGFLAGASVRWGSTNLTTNFVSAEQLTATIPASLMASPGIFGITVANPGGAASNAFNFTVLQPAPTITALNPSSTLARSPQFTLTVNGSGFISTSTVNWNGTPLHTTFVSASQIRAIVPAASIATPGQASVTVANPGDGTSQAAVFQITAPTVPAISSLSPATVTAGGAAFTLTVMGSNFDQGSRVRWDGSPLTTTFVSTTQLRANVAAAAISTAGNVVITVISSTGEISAGAALRIELPALPKLTLEGLPDTTQPAKQHQGQAKLDAPYPKPLICEVTLQFEPAAGVPLPAGFSQSYQQVQFATGGIKSAFNIPAGSTTINLPGIQTGSVAGKVTVLVTSVQVDNQTVQLGSTPVHTVEVASSAPTISSIQVVRNSSGFEIRITGDSSVRQMADLSVTFAGPAGSDLRTTSLTISLADLFTAYFNNSNSSRFGSTYLLTVPFVIEGTQSAVNSVSAALTNRIGRSATSSATF